MLSYKTGPAFRSDGTKRGAGSFVCTDRFFVKALLIKWPAGSFNLHLWVLALYKLENS